jgi:hypothetical protein
MVIALLFRCEERCGSSAVNVVAPRAPKLRNSGAISGRSGQGAEINLQEGTSCGSDGLRFSHSPAP